jgi:uncharacterized protein YcsI (UPF0317 family)
MGEEGDEAEAANPDELAGWAIGSSVVFEAAMVIEVGSLHKHNLKLRTVELFNIVTPKTPATLQGSAISTPQARTSHQGIVATNAHLTHVTY